MNGNVCEGPFHLTFREGLSELSRDHEELSLWFYAIKLIRGGLIWEEVGGGSPLTIQVTCTALLPASRQFMYSS